MPMKTILARIHEIVYSRASRKEKERQLRQLFADDVRWRVYKEMGLEAPKPTKIVEDPDKVISTP